MACGKVTAAMNAKNKLWKCFSSLKIKNKIKIPKIDTNQNGSASLVYFKILLLLKLP